jgi:hypothetical protein
VSSPGGAGGVALSQSVTGPLLHIALRLADCSASGALPDRLRAKGIAITEIEALNTFLFPDSAGIWLEATCPPLE